MLNTSTFEDFLGCPTRNMFEKPFILLRQVQRKVL